MPCGVIKMKRQMDAAQDSAVQDFADLHSTALQTAAASNETCEAAKKGPLKHLQTHEIDDIPADLKCFK